MRSVLSEFIHEKKAGTIILRKKLKIKLEFEMGITPLIRIRGTFVGFEIKKIV
jgi:hypothetical protein